MITIPQIIDLNKLPLLIHGTIATKYAKDARSANGSTLFPGSNTARTSVIGIKIIPAATVVGCPIRIAESSPT